MNIFRHHPAQRTAFRFRGARLRTAVMPGILMSLVAWLCPHVEAAPATQTPSAEAPQGDSHAAANSAQATPNPAAAPQERHFYIKEYRVTGGGHLLPRIEVEGAVYPFLGPYRTTGDVEEARGALEQAYRQKGYQTVTVQIPQQQVTGGIITLQVMPGRVARLRVHGSRYFSLDQIRREAPSLQEGTSPNFSQVTRDLLVLNGLPDRRVTPTLSAGEVPGTVDVDLNVSDSPPVHGSLEINNRYSADTTPLRINGSVSYDNLWQLEHSLGFSFQVSPENLNQVKVFSGYYLARLPDVSNFSFILQGTDQDSNVNTLGGIGVAGKGDVIGGRAVFTLPAQKDFYHSLSLGVDYKHFEQDVLIAGTRAETPVTYYPLSAAYSGSWVGKGYDTELNASVTFALRGLGSSEEQYEENRHGADGGFIYFRGDLSHTRDLPEGFQACHLVVETGHWYSGKEIVISPKQVERISYADSKVFVTTTKEAILKAPEYHVPPWAYKDSLNSTP